MSLIIVRSAVVESSLIYQVEKSCRERMWLCLRDILVILSYSKVGFICALILQLKWSNQQLFFRLLTLSILCTQH